MKEDAKKAFQDILNIAGYSVDKMCQNQINIVRQALDSQCAVNVEGIFDPDKSVELWEQFNEWHKEKYGQASYVIPSNFNSQMQFLYSQGYLKTPEPKTEVEEISVFELHSKIDMDVEDIYGRKITNEESIAIGTAMTVLKQQGFLHSCKENIENLTRSDDVLKNQENLNTLQPIEGLDIPVQALKEHERRGYKLTPVEQAAIAFQALTEHPKTEHLDKFEIKIGNCAYVDGCGYFEEGQGGWMGIDQAPRDKQIIVGKFDGSEFLTWTVKWCHVHGWDSGYNDNPEFWQPITPPKSKGGA